MIKTIELRKLTPTGGMTLYNGETLSKEVYLGITDSPENWREIPDAEAEELRRAREAIDPADTGRVYEETEILIEEEKEDGD